MHHEYRRRVQFLLDQKRQVGWFTRLLIGHNRLANEIVRYDVVHAIDMTMLKIKLHYRWHYTVSSHLNPIVFPDDISIDIVNHGLIFSKVSTITLRYTDFMK